MNLPNPNTIRLATAGTLILNALLTSCSAQIPNATVQPDATSTRTPLITPHVVCPNLGSAENELYGIPILMQDVNGALTLTPVFDPVPAGTFSVENGVIPESESSVRVPLSSPYDEALELVIDQATIGGIADGKLPQGAQFDLETCVTGANFNQQWQATEDFMKDFEEQLPSNNES